MDNGSIAVLVLLDLSAAFDTVSHAILLNRLETRFGITGPALTWLKSYLQSVLIGDKTSSEQSLDSGVPQGSVLGPILFTAYTTPLGDVIRQHNLQYHLYADDTQLYITFSPGTPAQASTIDHLNNCLKDVRSWMQSNLLKLNDSKTEVIIFGTARKLQHFEGANVYVGESRITPSPSVRNLGIQYDSTMSMENHVNLVCPRLMPNYILLAVSAVVSLQMLPSHWFIHMSVHG